MLVEIAALVWRYVECGIECADTVPDSCCCHKINPLDSCRFGYFVYGQPAVHVFGRIVRTWKEVRVAAEDPTVITCVDIAQLVQSGHGVGWNQEGHQVVTFSCLIHYFHVSEDTAIRFTHILYPFLVHTPRFASIQFLVVNRAGSPPI